MNLLHYDCTCTVPISDLFSAAVYENEVYRIVGRTSVDIIKSGGYKIRSVAALACQTTVVAALACQTTVVADEIRTNHLGVYKQPDSLCHPCH